MNAYSSYPPAPVMTEPLSFNGRGPFPVARPASLHPRRFCHDAFGPPVQKLRTARAKAS